MKNELRIRGPISGLGFGRKKETKELLDEREDKEPEREDKELELELVGSEYEHSELAIRSRGWSERL